MHTGKFAALPLDSVYISLTAEREASVTTNSLTISIRKTGRLIHNEGMEPLPDYEEFVVETGESLREYRAKHSKEKEHSSDQGTERVDLPQAIRNSTRMVVLGDPGAGKTVLTCYLARHFALAYLQNELRVLVTSLPALTASPDSSETLPTEDYGLTRLPIRLRIADYAEALRQDGNLRLHDFLFFARGEAEISEKEATTLFADALKNGQALVILDGLDEVAETTSRAEIARRVDDFAHGIRAENRILVTSRIVGYESARLNAGFISFAIHDTEMPQIEQFVRRRIAAYEREQTPGLSEMEIQKRAQSGIEEILRNIHENEGVRRLAVKVVYTSFCRIGLTC